MRFCSRALRRFVLPVIAAAGVTSASSALAAFASPGTNGATSAHVGSSGGIFQ